MSNLRERWFGTAQEEVQREEEIREEIRNRRYREAEFVRAAYMEEFEELLETWLMAHEPSPGPHEEMLFNSGARKGLLIVREHIRRLKKNTEDVSL